MTPDQVAQWRKAYISTMVGNGVDPANAEASYDAGEHDFSDSPVAAAHDEMSHWDNDG